MSSPTTMKNILFGSVFFCSIGVISVVDASTNPYTEATAIIQYGDTDNEPALGMFDPLAYKSDKHAALEGEVFVGVGGRCLEREF